MKKKLIYISGGVAGLVLILVLALLLFVDVNQYRGLIETRLENQLGRDVSLGEMSLGLLPLRVQVEDVSVSEAPGFGEADFVGADRLAVRVGLLALLGGNVRVRSLDLERPRVELVRDAQGVWNFSTLGSGGESGSEEEADAGESGDAGELTLDRLTVTDGQIAVSDLGTRTRAVYDHIDFTLGDYAPGEPFSFDVAAHLPGEGTEELRLAGTGGPVVATSPLETPFMGSLTLDEVGVEGLRAFLGSEAIGDAAGWLSGTTDVSNQSGIVAAVGNLELDRARFNGVEVGYPIAIDYDVDADLVRSRYTITTSTVQLGDTPLGLAGWIDRSGDPATMALRLTSGEVPIAQIARLASAFGFAFPPEARVDGRASLDVQADGTTDNPQLSGTIAGRDLQITGSSIAQPVDIPVLDLALSRTRIESNQFDIISGDTRATARFALDDYASEAPRIDARVQAPGASLPEIQSIASAYGVTGLDRIEGAGSLDVDLRASGPLGSEDSTAMMRALNGLINVDFSPLTFMGVNTASQLGSIGGFTAGSGLGDLTEVVRMTGQIAIANGIASTDNLVAELPMGTLAAIGTADLATETLDLDLQAVLTSAFSQSVGGTGIGGYLSTALSNAEGQIILPVKVSGTFDAPQFAPDTAAIGRMQGERLLPSLRDPSSLLDALTGGGNRSTASEAPGPEGAAEGEESAGEENPVNAIRGILGGILGGGSNDEN